MDGRQRLLQQAPTAGRRFVAALARVHREQEERDAEQERQRAQRWNARNRQRDYIIELRRRATQAARLEEEARRIRERLDEIEVLQQSLRQEEEEEAERQDLGVIRFHPPIVEPPQEAIEALMFGVRMLEVDDDAQPMEVDQDIGQIQYHPPVVEPPQQALENLIFEFRMIAVDGDVVQDALNEPMEVGHDDVVEEPMQIDNVASPLPIPSSPLPTAAAPTPQPAATPTTSTPRPAPTHQSTFASSPAPSSVALSSQSVSAQILQSHSVSSPTSSVDFVAPVQDSLTISSPLRPLSIGSPIPPALASPVVSPRVVEVTPLHPTRMPTTPSQPVAFSLGPVDISPASPSALEVPSGPAESTSIIQSSTPRMMNPVGQGSSTSRRHASPISPRVSRSDSSDASISVAPPPAKSKPSPSAVPGMRSTYSPQISSSGAGTSALSNVDSSAAEPTVAMSRSMAAPLMITGPMSGAGTSSLDSFSTSTPKPVDVSPAPEESSERLGPSTSAGQSLPASSSQVVALSFNLTIRSEPSIVAAPIAVQITPAHTGTPIVATPAPVVVQCPASISTVPQESPEADADPQQVTMPIRPRLLSTRSPVAASIAVLTPPIQATSARPRSPTPSLAPETSASASSSMGASSNSQVESRQQLDITQVSSQSYWRPRFISPMTLVSTQVASGLSAVSTPSTSFHFAAPTSPSTGHASSSHVVHAAAPNTPTSPEYSPTSSPNDRIEVARISSSPQILASSSPVRPQSTGRSPSASSEAGTSLLNSSLASTQAEESSTNSPPAYSTVVSMARTPIASPPIAAVTPPPAAISTSQATPSSFAENMPSTSQKRQTPVDSQKSDRSSLSLMTSPEAEQNAANSSPTMPRTGASSVVSPASTGISPGSQQVAASIDSLTVAAVTPPPATSAISTSLTTAPGTSASILALSSVDASSTSHQTSRNQPEDDDSTPVHPESSWLPRFLPPSSLIATRHTPESSVASTPGPATTPFSFGAPVSPSTWSASASTPQVANVPAAHLDSPTFAASLRSPMNVASPSSSTPQVVTNQIPPTVATPRPTATPQTSPTSSGNGSSLSNVSSTSTRTSVAFTPTRPIGPSTSGSQLFAASQSSSQVAPASANLTPLTPSNVAVQIAPATPRVTTPQPIAVLIPAPMPPVRQTSPIVAAPQPIVAPIQAQATPQRLATPSPQRAASPPASPAPARDSPPGTPRPGPASPAGSPPPSPGSPAGSPRPQRAQSPPGTPSSSGSSSSAGSPPPSPSPPPTPPAGGPIRRPRRRRVVPPSECWLRSQPRVRPEGWNPIPFDDAEIEIDDMDDMLTELDELLRELREYDYGQRGLDATRAIRSLRTTARRLAGTQYPRGKLYALELRLNNLRARLGVPN